MGTLNVRPAYRLASFCRATVLALALVPVFAPTAQAARAGAGGAPGDVYFKQITLDEAAQFISRIGRTSIVVTSSVASKVVSLYLRDVSVEGMVKNLSRAAGVWYRYDNQTRTYILMNAQEYQQDIAITRDEITRSYVLRHHNVVSIANAIEALFGERVSLVEPVEEMPPVEMGGTSRTSGGSSEGSDYGGNGAYGGNNGAGRNGGAGSSRRSFTAEGVTARRSGGNASGASKQLDIRKEMSAVSQSGLDASLEIDSSQVSVVETSEVLAATSRQGPPINVTYNKLHNLLLVRTSDEVALKDIEALIHDMDRPPRQVLLEMRILEVELGKDFRSVFDIGGTDGARTSPGPSSLGINGSTTNGLTPEGVYPRFAAGLGNFGDLANPTGVWQFVSDHLRVRLQLLESKNRVNVLATPMLVAANNQPAQLFIGDEQILITGASSDSVTGTTGATSTNITVDTEKRNVGQTLIILPRINADRSVTLTIDQDNSRINKGATLMPVPLGNGQIQEYPIDTVNTANLQVTAHARDGLTVAVGGMISQRIADAEEKVPLLGDIPGLGNLFKRTVRTNSRKQIVLLITPWVLETPEAGDALAREKEDQAQRLDASQRGRADWMGGKRRSIFDAEPGTQAEPAAAEGDRDGNEPAPARKDLSDWYLSQ